MSELKKLERVKKAISPLTEDTQFRLVSVAYGEYYPSYAVQIVSDDFILVFHGMDLSKFPATYCLIYSLHLKKWFSVKEIFLEMNIHVPFGRHNPEYDLSENRNVPVTDVDMLGFYQDVDRLCKEIKPLLSDIRIFLEKKAINNSYPTLRVLQCAYPVDEGRQPPGPNWIEKPVPDFENLFLCMKPLRALCDKTTITLHIAEGRVDITCYYVNICRILFHEKGDGTTDLFFVFNRWTNYMEKFPEIQREGKEIVFSFANVFRMLQIDYSYSPKGTIEDFRDYCQLIADNSDQILAAFSGKNIALAYNFLREMSGNSRDEVNTILAGLNNLVD